MVGTAKNLSSNCAGGNNADSSGSKSPSQSQTVRKGKQHGTRKASQSHTSIQIPFPCKNVLKMLVTYRH